MRKEKEFLICVVVITLQGTTSISSDDIANLINLSVTSSTSYNYQNYVIVQAQITLRTKQELPQEVILKYCELKRRSSRPKTYNLTKKTSLRNAFLTKSLSSFTNATFNIYNKVISARIASQITRSLSLEHPYYIIKRRRPKKFVLRVVDIINRKEYYSQQLLSILTYNQKGYMLQKVIFIMLDKTPIHFRGPIRHIEYVTILEGAKNIPPIIEDQYLKFIL